MLHVNANESNEKSILHKEDTTIWQEGRDTRSDKRIGTIRKEAKKNGGRV